MGVIVVEPLRWWEHALDACFDPVMRCLAGTFSEAPQMTHFWNNKKLSQGDVQDLNDSCMVYAEGVCMAKPRRWGVIPIFHMPIFGGWRDYIVIAPEAHQKRWYVGWICTDVVGISRVELAGPVRVLLGAAPVTFFGVDVHGYQIHVRHAGRGVIGEGGSFSQLPLL
jgi:hypothetical protein